MSKAIWVCGVSLLLGFFSAACSDSDSTPASSASAGADNGGSSGAGVAGLGGAPSATASCLADGTTLQVTATADASAYVIAGLPAAASNGTGDNNALTLCRGFTYTFALSVSGHPFYIKTARVTGADSAYDSGVTTNGETTGNVEFAVPADAPDTLFYQCAVHPAMGATITIVDPS